MNTPSLRRRNATVTDKKIENPPSAKVRRTRAPKAPAQSMGEPFAPITTRRISEEISARVREQISSGVLLPGARLPTERELAEQFAVSRMAVREGMRTLEVAGLILLKKGRHGGAFVSESSAKLVTQQVRDMIDLGRASLPMLMEARLMMMDVVVRLACERATLADFRALEDNVNKTELLTAAGHLEERSLVAIEFNKLLADATRNHILSALVEGLSEVLRHFIINAGPRPIDIVVPSRRKLIEQLRARDEEAAASTMAQYLKDTHNFLLRQAKKIVPGKVRVSH